MLRRTCGKREQTSAQDRNATTPHRETRPKLSPETLFTSPPLTERDNKKITAQVENFSRLSFDVNLCLSDTVNWRVNINLILSMFFIYSKDVLKRIKFALNVGSPTV